MTRLEALRELLAKVKAGTINDRFDPWLERALYHAFSMREVYLANDTYNGSLDAAKALHEAVLPGWQAAIRISSGGAPSRAVLLSPMSTSSGLPNSITTWSNTPARAWLIAIIEALIAMEEDA